MNLSPRKSKIIDRARNITTHRRSFDDYLVGLLMQAGEGQLGTDESTFNMVLCARSAAQLRATFDAYRQVTDRDIEDAINSETSAVLRDGYLAVGMTAICIVCLAHALYRYST